MKKLFNNFYREIRRLRSLYYGSLMAFHNQKSLINSELSNKKTVPKEKIYYKNLTDENYLLASSSFELSNKYKSGFPKTLREIILIRSISALEVYLISVIKEIFLNRKELFQDNQKIEFYQAELLSCESISEVWSKIINKETRKLQNQGIVEISKYFKNNFSIDFNNSIVPFSKIQKIYDIRHLFVHRLGKTDKPFRDKYNSDKDSILITESDLHENLCDIFEFGNYIFVKATELINQKKMPFNYKGSVHKYSILLNTDDIPEIFNARFSFLSGDNVYNLKDILVENVRNDNIIEIKITGDSQVIKDYKKLILKKIGSGEITIIKKNKDKNVKVPEEFLGKIRAELPPEPLPFDIHKSISKKLGINEKIVYKAIGLIRNKNSAEHAT